ncbi:MAG: FtsW/RodA/SpoVE family cell cycle protein [Eubacteriales bacterium]|nr:FtsW/RodA/SpoVE family cell cycle protein [Clostridiales bacterium]MDY5835604.1 FtsW/RodA/SpoVE family cell cycle protein [Eubacteriales bacterium]
MAISDLNTARQLKAEQERARVVRKTTQNQITRDIETYGRIDLSLLFIFLVILCFGLILLFSASLSSAYADQGDPLYYVRRQLIFTGLGAVMIFILLRFPIRFFNRFFLTIIVYFACTLSLLAVIFAGVQGDYGAVRWLDILGVQFQPSEMCKVGAIFCLATYFPAVPALRNIPLFHHPDDEKKQLKSDAFLYITFPALAMGAWLILIFIQPHLSGALIVGALVLTLFLMAKIPARIWLRGLRQLIPLILIGVLLIALIYPLLHQGESFMTFIGERFAHVFSRLNTFNNPDAASSDSIHQIQQARYALGSGGLTGKGLGMGRQKSGFLPMVYNDFILPSIGEELGYLGSLAVLLLFVFFFLRGTRISMNASSKYTAMLSFGSTLLITLQALLNIAVASEVIPTTGVSLPFFSYGGTAHVFMMLAVGFILSVSKTGQRADPELLKIIRLENEYRKSYSRPRAQSNRG